MFDTKTKTKAPAMSNYQATVSTLQSLWLDYNQGNYRGKKDIENWGHLQSGFNDKWGYVFD